MFCLLQVFRDIEICEVRELSKEEFEWHTFECAADLLFLHFHLCLFFTLIFLILPGPSLFFCQAIDNRGQTQCHMTFVTVHAKMNLCKSITTPLTGDVEGNAKKNTLPKQQNWVI